MSQAVKTKLRGFVAAFTALVLTLALVPATAFADWDDDATGDIYIYTESGSSITLPTSTSVEPGDDARSYYKVYKIANITLNATTNVTSLNPLNTSYADELSAWAESGSASDATALLEAASTHLQEISVTSVSAYTNSNSSSAYNGLSGVKLEGNFTYGVYYVQIQSYNDTDFGVILVSIEPEATNGTWTGYAVDAEALCKGTTSTTLTKTVEREGDGVVYKVGDTINYKVTFNVSEYTAAGYYLTDSMGSGLRYNRDVKLYTSAGTELTENIHYTLSNVSNSGFTLTLNDAGIQTLAATTSGGTGSYIEYSATLVSGASVENTDNTVTSSSGGSTVGGTVTEDALAGIELTKVDSSSSSTILAGAVFTIYQNGTAVGTLTTTADGDDYKIYDINSSTTEIFLNPEYTYTIRETEAPAGYALDTDTIITVYAAGTTGANYVLSAGSYTELGNITNTKSDAQTGDGSGINLPTTGGMGTIIFTVVGVLVMAGAAYLIIRSRKQQLQD